MTKLKQSPNIGDIRVTRVNQGGASGIGLRLQLGASEAKAMVIAHGDQTIILEFTCSAGQLQIGRHNSHRLRQRLTPVGLARNLTKFFAECRQASEMLAETAQDWPKFGSVVLPWAGQRVQVSQINGQVYWGRDLRNLDREVSCLTCNGRGYTNKIEPETPWEDGWYPPYRLAGCPECHGKTLAEAIALLREEGWVVDEEGRVTGSTEKLHQNIASQIEEERSQTKQAVEVCG